MEKIESNNIEEVSGGAYQRINKGDTYYEFTCKRCAKTWTSKSDSTLSDRSCPDCKDDCKVVAFEMIWQ